MHLFENSSLARAALPFETWDGLNHGNPRRRIYVARELEKMPGALLVFVHYDYPRHQFQDEWVYNAADIDDARVVWARDLGPEQNAELERYYPNRRAVFLRPDENPPEIEAAEPNGR
jgi:hypothetical protein